MMSVSTASALLACLASLSICQPIVEEAGMEQAVAYLADSFASLRSEQLGVAALEVRTVLSVLA